MTYVFELADGTKLVGYGEDYYEALKYAQSSTGRDTEKLEVVDFYIVKD